VGGAEPARTNRHHKHWLGGPIRSRRGRDWRAHRQQVKVAETGTAEDRHLIQPIRRAERGARRGKRRAEILKGEAPLLTQRRFKPPFAGRSGAAGGSAPSAARGRSRRRPCDTRRLLRPRERDAPVRLPRAFKPERPKGAASPAGRGAAPRYLSARLPPTPLSSPRRGRSRPQELFSRTPFAHLSPAAAAFCRCVNAVFHFSRFLVLKRHSQTGGQTESEIPVLRQFTPIQTEFSFFFLPL